MAFFNYSTMQMAAKIVYYGPGLGGKTSNLQYIYNHTSTDTRGEMVSLETATDRTLFFDLLPLEVGAVAGFKTRIQLYTVPGQVFYNTTRKLVLKGVDGIVFVADSQKPMLQANVDSLRNLEENLAELDLALHSVPLVLQYNKRDLAQICDVEELDEALNLHDWPWFEASALTGDGVFETLKEASKLTLVHLKKRLVRSDAATAVSRPAPPAVKPRKAAPERPGSLASSDALAQLERIRSEALRPLGRAKGSANGRHEISRDVHLELSREDRQRARRFAVSLRIVDEEARVVHESNGLDIDLEPLPATESLLLRLNIALDAPE